MEKTLQFALNEALEIGRQSAMPQFLEKEIWEKVAQVIEDSKLVIAIDDSAEITSHTSDECRKQRQEDVNTLIKAIARYVRNYK
jgi:c-di-GMP-related signal transduction protein